MHILESHVGCFTAIKLIRNKCNYCFAECLLLIMNNFISNNKYINKHIRTQCIYLYIHYSIMKHDERASHNSVALNVFCCVVEAVMDSAVGINTNFV